MGQEIRGTRRWGTLWKNTGAGGGGGAAAAGGGGGGAGGATAAALGSFGMC